MTERKALRRHANLCKLRYLSAPAGPSRWENKPFYQAASVLPKHRSDLKPSGWDWNVILEASPTNLPLSNPLSPSPLSALSPQRYYPHTVCRETLYFFLPSACYCLVSYDCTAGDSAAVICTRPVSTAHRGEITKAHRPGNNWALFGLAANRKDPADKNDCALIKLFNILIEQEVPHQVAYTQSSVFHCCIVGLNSGWWNTAQLLHCYVVCVVFLFQFFDSIPNRMWSIWLFSDLCALKVGLMLHSKLERFKHL